MLADMDKPYDLVALPTDCPEGMYLWSATKFEKGDYFSFLTHLILLSFISKIIFFSVESACQGGQEVGGNNCRRDQMCLPDGVGSYICLCGDGDKFCNGNR